MNTLGNVTRNVIYKLGSHNLSEGFTQDGLNYSLTFSADTVTGNTIAGNVGVDTVSVVWATSAAATLTAVAAAISAIETVRKTVVDQTNKRIYVYPKNQNTGVALLNFLVTGGASQATIATAIVDNRVRPGMPVEIMVDSVGSIRIKPVTASTADLTCIGTVLSKPVNMPDNGVAKEPEQATVNLRGNMAVTAQASITSLLPGPVAYAGWDTVNNQPKVTSTSVTVTNQFGWAIDAGTNIGDQVRVLIK